MKIEKLKDLKSQKGYQFNQQYFVAYEGNSQFDANNQDYLACLDFIKNGGKLEPEFTPEELLKRAKEDKLAQLETNYQNFVDKPFKAKSKLIENGVPTNKDVEYNFDCQTKDDAKRDPTVVCFATMLNYLANKNGLINKALESAPDFNSFKQIIIEGDKTLLSKIYTPYITKDLNGNKIVAMFSYLNATQLAMHIGTRIASALENKAKIIADINNCKTIEELEKINIDF
jgi:hypothetical protein